MPADVPPSDGPSLDGPSLDEPSHDAPGVNAPVFDAVVLAGGRGVRAGGVDKPGLRVGGQALVARVVATAVSAGARSVIVVGPPRTELMGISPAPPGGLLFAREEPPGAGPVPALRAAMPHVSSPLLALLAGDTPFLTPRQLEPLLAAVTGPAGDGGPAYSGRRGSHDSPAGQASSAGGGSLADGGGETGGAGPTSRRDPPDVARTADAGGTSGRGCPVARESRAGALLLDDGGHPQWLAGCWRTATLAAALAGYEGRSLRGLLDPLRPVMLPCPRAPGEPPPWLDCDTAEELALARRWAGEPEQEG